MSRQPNNASWTPVLRPTQFSSRRTNKSSIATKLHSIPVYSHISGNIDMEIDNYTTYIIEVKDLPSLEFDPGYFSGLKKKNLLYCLEFKKKFYLFKPRQYLLKVYLV